MSDILTISFISYFCRLSPLSYLVKLSPKGDIATSVLNCSSCGNRQKRCMHPGRRLSCALAEESLVAIRQGAGRDLRHICSAGRADMAQRLNDGPGWAAGRNQMLT